MTSPKRVAVRATHLSTMHDHFLAAARQWAAVVIPLFLVSACRNTPEAPPLRQAVHITVTTLAGAQQGYTDGTAGTARFNFPNGIALASDGTLYVADMNNFSIRKITPAGEVSTWAGGQGGFTDGSTAEAKFNLLYGMAIDNAGTLYVTDPYNSAIRKIDPAGRVTTLAGGQDGYQDGTGPAARFRFPRAVAIGPDGNLFVADSHDHRIRKISPAGVVSTLAGDGTEGTTDGPGVQAQFTYPTGIAVAGDGTVYVGEGPGRIRRITPAGEVSTLVASQPGVVSPVALAVSPEGSLYMVETADRIRRITTGGLITDLTAGARGYADGSGTQAKFHGPTALAVSTNGTLYVTDGYNHCIRKVTVQ